MNNDFEFQTACIESLLNIEQAFGDADKCGGMFGGWALSKNEIRSFALHVLSTCSAPNIVKLGWVLKDKNPTTFYLNLSFE